MADDETWVIDYGPGASSRVQNSTPFLLRPLKVQMTKSKQRFMLIYFFGRHGVILKEVVLPGQI